MSDRPPHVTPSKMKTLMAKNGLGAGAKTYADEIILQFLDVDKEEYEGFWLRRGNELEPDAKKAYMRERLIEVQDKRRIKHPDHDFISGEPDGLVGDNGGIEIKCPKAVHHKRNLTQGIQIDDYYCQIQGYMFITDRDWWDFVSFHPGFPEPLQLAIKPVERNQEYIDKLEARCVKFWEEMVEPRKQELLNYI